jgi:hypothetical protein
MVGVLSLHYGVCSITVLAGNEVMARHLEEVAQKYPAWVQSRPQSADCTLMLLSPDGDGVLEPRWRATGEVWATARKGLRSPSPEGLAAWRALYHLGELVDRGVFLFQDRAGGPDDFVCLVPTDTLIRPWHPSAWIVHAVEALAVHWHAEHGGGALHASAVARRDSGYLFVGSSSAGKSTVAALSQQAQGTVIHEDQALLSLRSGQYVLSQLDGHATPALRAVFLLKKGNANHVMPLAPRAVCAGLAKSVLEYAVGQDHFGSWVRQAFHNMAEVARDVPGYVLEFRKSPDFWDVIDAELGT